MRTANLNLDRKLDNVAPTFGWKSARNGVAALLVLTVVVAQADPLISVGPVQMPATAAPMAAATAVVPARDWAPVDIRLDPPPSAMSAATSPVSGPGPLQIGFGRPVAPLEDTDRFAARQVWHNTADGRHAASFQVTSPEAKGLRLGLRVVAIPDEALVRFYDPEGKVVRAVTGAEIKATIQRNLAAGDTGEDAETYWSPLIEGETQILDIELPAGAHPGEVRMAVPRLSHLFQSPLDTDLVQPAAAAYCHNDVSCYPEWDLESRATAKMVYTKDALSYLCTGTLLNDADTTTFIPYFLSANHCISTQSVASTLQTIWFYRSASCNGGAVGPFPTRSNGADLLYQSSTTDTSFMRLRASPPAGAVFAGWSASLPALDEYLTGLHHPDGDLQKISFGDVVSYGVCVPSGLAFSCGQTEPEAATHFWVSWVSGTAQPGSSGSGVFDANYHLVGTLTGGPPTTDYCGAIRYAIYGRFDIPFYDELQFWLNFVPPQIPWPWNS